MDEKTMTLTTNQQSSLLSSRVRSMATPRALALMRMDNNVPHYKKVAFERRVQWLVNVIGKLNVIKHQNMNATKEELTQMFYMDADTLDGFIMMDIYISDFTFEEIYEAFMIGLSGNYGEYYGLNAVTLFKFLKCYLQSPKKQEAARLVREARKREENEAYVKQQREKAKLEGWGVKMVTIDDNKMTEMAKDMVNKPREDSSEHRERVRKQAKEILEKYGNTM